MELEKELSELVKMAYESEYRIRDLFRFCCPPSLRQACQEFCHGLSYGGTVVMDNDKPPTHQRLDWGGYHQIVVVGNYDVAPMYIFQVCYFGGNFVFAAKYARGKHGLLHRDYSERWWYTATGPARIDEELQKCVAALTVEAVSRFLQEIVPVFGKVESALWQFMSEKVKECGGDTEYLLYQAHQWLSLQREASAHANALREERDSLMKHVLHIQNELREIVAGISASKSFAKSKALKALRERGEAVLRTLT